MRDTNAKPYTMEGSCIGPVGKPMTIKQVVEVKDANTRTCSMQFESEGQVSTMSIAYSRKTKS